MTQSVREVNESPVYQGEEEEIRYEFDFTRWGAPSNPAVTLTNLTTGADAADLLSGETSTNGNVVTAPTVSGVSAGHRYRLECVATIGGNRLGMYLIIEGE